MHIDFNYDNPSNWSSQIAGIGKRQSPIELCFHKSRYGSIRPILFHFYDVPLAQPIKVTNNGHTVNVSIGPTIDGKHPGISGGGLKDRYVVDNIHFHWGSPKSRGSEHKISGMRFDLEMHIVHKNSKYKTVQEALEDPCGIAVLGILFKSVKKSNLDRSGINEIYDILPNVSQYNSTDEIKKPITMQSIIGDLKTNQYFTYCGSLTTPPCSEAVKWFVFPNALPIDSEDLQKFFKIYDNRNLPLLNNFRPIQTSRCRKVSFRSNKPRLPRG